MMDIIDEHANLRVGTKRIASSLTETTHTVVHADMNGESRLFGGRLMEWIDDAAAIAARRHCGGSVTTACVDSLTFEHPAFLNDIVVIIARLTYVGRTSAEVRADTYVEDCRTGGRNKINTAYLTEVFVGPDERPRPIRYGLELVGDDEREEWEAARRRIEIRRQRKAEGV